MKKIFFVLAALFFAAINVDATVYKYQTNSFAYQEKLRNGQWGTWSEWEESSLLVVINLDDRSGRINIYSEKEQEHDVTEFVGEESDGQGGSGFSMRTVDKNGLKCTIRLRKQKDGVQQLYVEYNDVRFVYCLQLK